MFNFETRYTLAPVARPIVPMNHLTQVYGDLFVMPVDFEDGLRTEP